MMPTCRIEVVLFLEGNPDAPKSEFGINVLKIVTQTQVARSLQGFFRFYWWCSAISLVHLLPLMPLHILPFLDTQSACVPKISCRAIAPEETGWSSMLFDEEWYGWLHLSLNGNFLADDVTLKRLANCQNHKSKPEVKLISGWSVGKVHIWWFEAIGKRGDKSIRQGFRWSTSNRILLEGMLLQVVSGFILRIW